MPYRPPDLGTYLGVGAQGPDFDPAGYDLGSAYGEGSPANQAMGEEGFLSRFLGAGDGAQTASAPAAPAGASPGQGPVGLEGFLQGGSNEEVRRWAMGEYARHLTEGPPKAKPVKLDWKEALGVGLAAQFNPNMIPVFMQQKMRPQQEALVGYQQRGRLLETMLGLTKPERPEYRGGPDTGYYEMSATRGGTPRQVIAPRPQRAQRPEKPTIFGSAEAGYHEYIEGGKSRQLIAPVAGAGGRGGLPLSVHGRFIDAGVNPLEPTESGYEKYQAVLAATPKKLDQKIQAEGRLIYQQVLVRALDRMTLGRQPTEEQMAQAQETALNSMESYLSQFQEAPAGGERPDLEERLQELLDDGYTRDEAFRIVEDEGY